MKPVLCVGHAVQDFIFRTPQLPRSAEKHRASGFRTIGGGPAATAAVSIAKLGGVARLAARVGDDPIADTIAAELRGFGVDCRHLRRFAGRQSSLSAVFVDDAGERLIVNHTDPDMPTEPDWLLDALEWEALAVVLADARWPEGAEAVLRAARARGLPAVLDADVPLPPQARLPSAATHVAFSLAGLREHAGCGPAPADVEAALLELASGLRNWSCVTLGADGVACVDARGVHPPAVERVPAFRVTPVDTLGAGDVWHGAFALALAEGCSESAAVRAACAAAAVKVTRHGGRAGAPTRAERDAMLETT